MSVYIHIPFCKKICKYCDFCKIFYNEELVDKYLNTLEKEIKTYYKNDLIKTIYIGGGTPSSLNEKQLLKLMETIKVFKLNKNYEFTFECNIEDINKNLLKILQENKVNRLSIGIESFNKKILNTLGRHYNFDINEKINLAKKYFSNINIDLMYGINNQTIKGLEDDLNQFVSLDITHISIYSLILEDNTILKINNYQELDEDIQREMYDYIRKYLSKNGYIHYEISNFAKPNYYSRHNLTYWNNNEYYGFGLGSSGFIEDVRYENTRSINKYLKNNYRLNEEYMTKEKNMENEMILGLRKVRGINKNTFYKKYNVYPEEIFNINKLNKNKNNYYISLKYLYISNYILCDFIDNF